MNKGTTNITSEKKQGKNYIAWIVMLAVASLYPLLYFLNSDHFTKAINKFFILSKIIYPYLILVFILMFITFLFLKPNIIKKHLGEESGLKGFLLTSVAGIISVGPAYVWYPLISDLQKNGMRNKLVTIFIYNRAIKIHLLPLMILYFGVEFSIIVTLLVFTFSFIVGEVVEKFTSERAMIRR